MQSITYFNDISEYVKHGRKQSSTEFLPTTYTDASLEKHQSITTQISTRFAQFGRVTIVAGLAIVSAPVAIASSIVAAPFSSLFCFVCSMKSNINKYIETPEQNRNLTKLLKKTGKDVLRSIAAFFLAIAVLSVDITLLATTFIAHTRHMQICQTLFD
jgi:hypothetical protein